MHSDNFDKGDILCCVFLPFVNEVRRVAHHPGRIETKRRLAEKAVAYLDLLEPAFSQHGGLAVRQRQAVRKFRTSPDSVGKSEADMDELLREATQQIEAMVLLMDVRPG
ncbi:UNVERIFIED_ORG: hypothetical protein QE446_004972 [Rhizobium sp. SORGH_AS260]|nr:hypothetical protein [Rhizobium sp. SORGH_AS_0285]MDP9757048.1 hypothetical protein [Rhizobium sp. SORGH_AS_0260]MDR6083703.1 hypothetical protein [Agrobacterium sp. SORGH_AS_0440]